MIPNPDKFFLISGPCAMEDYETALNIGRQVKAICDKLNIDFIFKSSYRKANRSRLDSFTGIGDEQALKYIQQIGRELGVPTITDIHESHEAAFAAQYVDNLQIPAFLCRQTDLLLAAGKTGKGINVKKGQFVSPEAMKFAVEKVKSTGNNNVWLCERGFSFGYTDLIVDATAIARLRAHGVPVVMDCTHSVQKPNTAHGVTGGDPEMIETIALAAIATGADGFFIETHTNPAEAQSDPHTMLQLNKLEGILTKAMKIRNALRS